MLYPTPVVLATSIEKGKKPNVCTLAWTGVLCSDPPQIGISVRPSRYSCDLIKDSGEFVANIPTADIVEETDYCGVVSGRDVDKFEETGFSEVSAEMVEPPLIGECPVNLECKVEDTVGLGSHILFIGRIVRIDVDEDVIGTSSDIDFEGLKPITWNPISREYYSLGKPLGKYGFSKN